MLALPNLDVSMSSSTMLALGFWVLWKILGKFCFLEIFVRNDLDNFAVKSKGGSHNVQHKFLRTPHSNPNHSPSFPRPKIRNNSKHLLSRRTCTPSLNGPLRGFQVGFGNHVAMFAS